MFKKGRSERKGDISPPEYRTESQSFRLWGIRGLSEGRCSLGGSHRRAEIGTGAQLGTYKRTQSGMSEVVWSIVI